MANEGFEAQVALLVRILPYVATEACFALKGGTAINLFVRNPTRFVRRSLSGEIGSCHRSSASSGPIRCPTPACQ